MTTCPKCSHVRSASDTAPEGKCPKCGVIYEKALKHQERVAAEQAERAIQQEKSARGRRILKIGTVFIALVAASAFGYMKHRDAQRAERQQAVDAAVAKLTDLKTRWNDASELAGSTSRIALSGPIATMQDLQRQVEAVSVPTCLQPAKDDFYKSAKAEVDVFLMFMRDTSEYDKTFQARRLEAVTSYAAFATYLRKSADHCSEFVSDGE